MVNPCNKYNLVLGFMLLTIFISQENQLQGVKGDEALITSTCSKTTRQFYCNQCLKSTARSEEEDLRGLAGTSISCVYNQALIVRQISADFAMNSTGPMSEELSRCVPFLDSVSDHVVVALLKWRMNKFADAAMDLQNSGDEYEKCTSQLGEFTPPPGFVSVFLILKARIELAEEIVKMLG